MPINRQPLHEQIADVLRREICSRFRPGDRLDAEARLAERFEVSIVTLREAMLTLCRDGLVQRRHGSGTYVLDMAAHKSVALLVSDAILTGQATFFFLFLTRRLRELLEARGIQARVFLGRFGDEDSAETPTGKALMSEVEGGRVLVVVSISVDPPAPWLDLLRGRGVPLVGGDAGYPYSVSSGSGAMVREGVRFLAGRGRRRVALLHWPGGRGAGERRGRFLSPFADELAAQGLAYREEWVFGSLNPTTQWNGWEAFRQVWQAGGQRPDGLLISDDCLYRESASALMALDIHVPQELLVVTHANKGSGIAYPFPTVRLEYDPEAHAAALEGMVARLVAGDSSAPPHVTIPFSWAGLDEVDSCSAGSDHLPSKEQGTT